MYTQLCVALLCAMNNGMEMTTLIALARRVGEACLRFWSGKKHEFRQRCLQEYAVGVSSLVWGHPSEDKILTTFFGGANGGGSSLHSKLCERLRFLRDIGTA